MGDINHENAAFFLFSPKSRPCLLVRKRLRMWFSSTPFC